MKTKLVLLLFSFCGLVQTFAQNAWIQRANLTGLNRATCIAFTIDSVAYVGLGYNFSQFPSQRTDIWKYDPATNAWTQMSSLPGLGRSASSAFSIGLKGYVVGGFNSSGTVVSELWEYNSPSNSWTQKTSCPGPGRDYAVAFSINGKGYFGSGYNSTSTNFNDFWEYNPATDSWLQRANVPGPARSSAVGFSIGTKGYIGSGFTFAAANDFWEFNPVNNTWTQKANMGSQGITDGSSFVINGEGYVCTGSINSTSSTMLLKYSPLTDTWTPMVNLTGPARSNACGFNIGNNGYISCGNDASFSQLNDLWELTTPTPLPVSLLSFSAEANSNNTIDIRWETATEINDKDFLVQRSQNNSVYSDIATINGSEHSNVLLNYFITDDSPVPGINYYRLCQVDLDGTRTYYPPVAVRMGESSDVLVYPNPARENLWIETPGNAQVTISDIYGKIIGIREVSKGISNTSVGELPSGLYTLKIQSGEDTFMKKIVVQK